MANAETADNHMNISANDPTAAFVLPSGKQATLRKGKGRDLMLAQRAVAGNPDPSAVLFALIAELVRIDGAPIVYEDILEMELGDVMTLHAEVVGANFPEPARDFPAPVSSRDLSASASESLS